VKVTSSSKEFLLEGRRIDFLAGRWTHQDHQLDILGVECKGDITPTGLSTIVVEQLSHYVRSVPKIYLACSMPREERLQDFAAFCRVAGVGMLVADGLGAKCLGEAEGDVNIRLDSVRYKEVRCRVAMFLAFTDKFGPQLLGGRMHFISTKTALDRPQWNTFLNPDDTSCYLGVNVDNASHMIATMNSAAIAIRMRELPSAARCEVTRVQFLSRSQRAWLPLRLAAASEVASELDWLARLTQTLGKGQSLSLTIGVPLWRRNEVLSRQLHKSRMDEAHKVLEPLYLAMGAKSRAS